MTLSPMRFGDYVWPHNPKTYTITYERAVSEHKVPFGRYVLQNTGLTHRVMRGEGEFAGRDAYNQFKKLAGVFYSEKTGVLVHPVWQASRAYFAGLKLLQEPKVDYVSYSFEFWECYEGYSDFEVLNASGSSADTAAKAGVSEHYHTVTQGETLWGIAQAYGSSLESVLALNPQIKNPNLIFIGDKVRVQ